MSPSNSSPRYTQEEIPLPRARQRRRQRSLLPEGPDDRTAWLETLARQLTPSYDFFLASLLSGFILAAAFLLQSGALLVLGILFSPFLGPVIGISLSTTTSSARFLVKSIISLVVASLFFFGFGALAGALAPIILDTPAASITTWNDYHWTNFLVIAIGVGLSVYMLARSPQLKPLVPNIAIAYGLLPPVVAAGFNLTAVSGSDWISPLTVTGVHLAWAILAGIVAFILVGQSPTTLSGFLATALMAGLLAAAFLSTDKAKTLMALSPTQPAVVINSTPTPTTAAAIPTPDLSAPSPSPTVTRTPTASFTSINTAWPSTTPQPTPIWARVSAPTGGGAFLRDKPDGKILTSILNGNMLEVISEPVYGNHGVIWVQIRTEDGFEGWIVQSLLATATPSAGW
ncbi:MAG: DUF389 domain-containing protein [Bellilinea sp.]